MTDEERYERERRFHDISFAGSARAADRFYVINGACMRHLDEAIEALPADARVLEYGCGSAAHVAISAARDGRRVTAFDLSPVAIDHARSLAENEGVADQIEFRVLNAEAVALPTGEFDAVFGTGVLHHLNLHNAYSEIARLLRPGGSAMFIEPMGHNPLINLYRSRTPGQRTDDEHPLVIEDLALAHDFFARVEPEYFSLLPLAVLPLAKLRGSDRLVRALDAADRALFRRMPSAGRYAWMVALRLRARDQQVR